MASVHTQILGRRAGARKGMVVLSVTMPNVATLADQNIFVADQAYQVVSVQEAHTVKGTDGGLVWLKLQGLSGTAVPAGGRPVLASATGINLKGDANTVVTPTLHATLGNTQLATGDRLGFYTFGTLTSVAGVVVTIVLIPLATTTGDTGDKRYWLSEV